MSTTMKRKFHIGCRNLQFHLHRKLEPLSVRWLTMQSVMILKVFPQTKQSPNEFVRLRFDCFPKNGRNLKVQRDRKISIRDLAFDFSIAAYSTAAKGNNLYEFCINIIHIVHLRGFRFPTFHGDTHISCILLC